MTALQAMTFADAVQPNVYEEALKLSWLSTLDGMLHAEVLAWHEDAPPVPGAYTADTRLLADEPYSAMYPDYLCAMMSMHDGAFERYQNAMIRFNANYAAFADHYNRTHPPLRRRNVHL